MNRVVSSSILLFFFAISIQSTHAENWPQWRGPRGTGVSSETDLPLKWSGDNNIAWSCPLPQWGNSTPAIWNNAIFLTSENDGRLLLLRINKSNGEIEWTRTVGEGTAHRKQPGSGNRTSKFHDLHNMASPSPVTDGEHVIAHFGNGLLASYTMEGEQLWSHNFTEQFGPYTIWWGHANSPVLYKNLVISVCMQDSMEGDWETLSPSYIIAHDKQTGDVVWKTMRMTGADAEQCDSYTTPIFYTKGEKTEMILMGGNQLDAYDPETGEQIWSLPGLVGGRTITGPTLEGQTVYTTVGMKGPLHAVRIEGSGRRTKKSAIAWSHEKGTPDSCSPVVANGLTFIVSDNGIATCLDAQTGELQWQHRLGGNFKASPIAADGRVYFLARDGRCTVIEASRKVNVLAENRLDDEFSASPAVSDGRIYLRGRKDLYAIGK